ncbi:hypothetical protein [Moorena producens]|uniref:hypothetical protein n=1 Tax=Moorena producens TaxID=1155739 RepID=UPI003C784027
MLKPFHPDGEGHPYQQTVAQASVAQASSLCSTLTSTLFVATEPAITLLAWQEDLSNLGSLVGFAPLTPQRAIPRWGVLLSKSPKLGGFRGQWVNPDLETLPIEDAL